MKIIPFFLLILTFLLIINCSSNKDEVTFNSEIKKNTIYFSIKNKLKNKSIFLIKPKHNYICYDGFLYYSDIYKNYFTINIMNKKDSLTTYKRTYNISNTYKNSSNYSIIEIKKNEIYSDSIFIPNIESDHCTFYPITDEETIVILINDTIFYK